MSVIVVHGGAGAWEAGSARLETALAACAEAAAAGQRILLESGSALNAVEAAVRVLEDCPALNAGRGSVPTTDGAVEMDALIMDGATLDLGAVAVVTTVRNPISLARLVMTRSPHTLLAGDGAERFADEMQVPRATLEELRRQPADARETGNTVGAVAIDARGTVAAATSTGGTQPQAPGRVGDTPLVGCGAYADDASGAATATGPGDQMMKLVISRLVCDSMAAGASPRDACAAALAMLDARLQAVGGLIAVDARGNAGIACTSAVMPYAIAREGEAPEAACVGSAERTGGIDASG